MLQKSDDDSTDRCGDKHLFHTPKGYRKKNSNQLTESMEDYLEMICRYAASDGYARVNVLASKLHVKPSSASKMVAHLKELELVEFEHYGIIQPTPKGLALGHYLLHRHEVLHEFLCCLNQSECELEQVEQIEHYMNENTVANLENLLKTMK